MVNGEDHVDTWLCKIIMGYKLAVLVCPEGTGLIQQKNGWEVEGWHTGCLRIYDFILPPVAERS